MRKFVIIISGLLLPNFVSASTGLSGGIGAAQGVALIFAGWLILSAFVAVIWQKIIKKKWVWILSPLLIIDISIIIIAMFPIIGEFIKYGHASKAALPFFLCLSLLVTGIIINIKSYKRTKSSRVKYLIPIVYIPIILISFPVILLTITNIT